MVNMKKNIKTKSSLITLVFLLAILLNGAEAATYIVTTNADAGAGSLRSALVSANATAGVKDTITFNILPSGSYTITLTGGALNIADDVVIDATTQPGYNAGSHAPVIELTGSGAMALKISAGTTGSVIKGFSVTGCAAMGINITTSGNIIQGCYIGLNLSGTSLPNNASGIQITNANGNIIGGTTPAERNVISANKAHGISITTGSRDFILGNYIGTDITGLLTRPNLANGININTSSSKNKIGGTSADSMNIISGNNQHGIEIDNSIGNIVQGNIIGLGSNGTTTLGNKIHGVLVNLSDSTLIGGSMRGARNIVSSNQSIGINVNQSKRVVIKNNFVGVDITGTVARGNQSNSIQVYDSRETVIGGIHSTEGNIISASVTGAGINLDHSSPTTNSNKCVIKGNYIGTDSAGKVAMGNFVIGAIVKCDSSIIGGLLPGEGNIIADTKLLCGLLLANASHNTVTGNFIGTSIDTLNLGNKEDGINISVENNGSNAINNTVQYNVIAYNGSNGINVGKALNNNINKIEYSNNLRFNSIFCNTAQGIFLNLTDPTDWGNNGKTAPLINGAKSTGTVLYGIPNGLLTTDSIDIYEMASCSNCASNPQGEIYVSTVYVDNSGNWSYTHPDNGKIYIAMATDASGNSSQFSLCFTPCAVTASAASSQSIVNLLTDHSVTLSSTVTVSSLNPVPAKYYWITNSTDTSLAFAKTQTATLNINPNTGTTANGDIKVYLIATQVGCVDTVSLSIKYYFVPNLVTPNGDNMNDKFEVSKSGDLFTVEIYNRWGEKVFAKEGYTNEWDVASATDGVYYYYLKDKTGQLTNYKGWVEVVK
jgi:hypothetical protein